MTCPRFGKFVKCPDYSCSKKEQTACYNEMKRLEKHKEKTEKEAEKKVFWEKQKLLEDTAKEGCPTGKCDI